MALISETDATPVPDFVNQFELHHRDEAVCFEADVYVYTSLLTFQFRSEIDILTVNRTDFESLYILNPDLSIKGFPRMFDIKAVSIIFKQKKGLLLKSSNIQHGDYNILIQPTGKNCEAPVREEFYPISKS